VTDHNTAGDADNNPPVPERTKRSPAQVGAALVALVLVLGGFLFGTWYVVSMVIRAEY